MAFFYKISNYRVPGTYQWVKPPTGVGAGPFGTTYLQTIATVIGPGSGGGSGPSNNNQNAGVTGGHEGNGGGYAQATYLPAALNALEDIIVAAGSLGQIATPQNGNVLGGSTTNDSPSVNATPSKFGAHIVSPGGFGSNLDIGGQPTVTGGSNVTNNRGGATPSIVFTNPPPFIGPTLLEAGQPTWQPTGNNAGGFGGITANLISQPGQGILAQNGGLGVNNSITPAQKGQVPGAGGGSSMSATPIFPVTGGAGADAIQNTGAGGGGGGGATSYFNAGGGFITGGQGGKGSNGNVQIVDIFTVPPPPPVYYFNLDLIAWFHTVNQARPISLTGRYKS